MSRRGSAHHRTAKPLIWFGWRSIAAVNFGPWTAPTRPLRAAIGVTILGCRLIWEVHNAMTTFDKREKGFEQKFAHDADLKFKAESRRNRALAEWAGAKLGLSGAELDEYIKAVRKADLAEKGDDDVFRKVKADLDAKGIAVTDTELRSFMAEALAKAVSDIESTKG